MHHNDHGGYTTKDHTRCMVANMIGTSCFSDLWFHDGFYLFQLGVGFKFLIRAKSSRTPTEFENQAYFERCYYIWTGNHSIFSNVYYKLHDVMWNLTHDLFCIYDAVWPCHDIVIIVRFVWFFIHRKITGIRKKHEKGPCSWKSHYSFTESIFLFDNKRKS